MASRLYDDGDEERRATPTRCLLLHLSGIILCLELVFLSLEAVAVKIAQKT